MPAGWRRIPFPRWSFRQLVFGMKHLTTERQVGDEKGLLLDAAIARVKSARIPEFGTYCGHSSLRMATAALSAELEYQSVIQDLVLESEYLAS